jgi:hypothetical protein
LFISVDISFLLLPLKGPFRQIQSLVLNGQRNSIFLYQAYLGRIQLLDDLTVDIFIDDEAFRAGTTGTMVGDVTRTWFDGVSYAGVEYVTIDSEDEETSI